MLQENLLKNLSKKNKLMTFDLKGSKINRHVSLGDEFKQFYKPSHILDMANHKIFNNA